MRSNAKTGLIGCVGALALAGMALAGPKQLTFDNVDAWGGGGAGGPFEVDPSGFDSAPQGLGEHGAADGRFITFCVERNEFVSEGVTYNAEINTAAVSGGVGGGSPDPLDARTAFLYTSFIKGTLGDLMDDAGLDHSFVDEDPASGLALQDAIWAIEQELTSVGAFAQDLIDLADQAVATGGVWAGKGIGNVRILNLTTVNGGAAQDQLVLIPLPVPAALGLVGLLGVGAASWRRRRAEFNGFA